MNYKPWFLLFILGLPVLVSGQSNAPKYSNEFLSLGVGAKHFGLGSSGVAYADDVSSGYWNPAGLLKVRPKHQLMLMHSSYFGGIANYDFGAFTTRLADSSRLALSIVRFSVDDIPDTRFLFDANGAINYDRIRSFSATDYAFLLSYARKLDFLGSIDFGGSAKIISRGVGSFSKAWGFGIDLGAQKAFNKLHVGLSLRDVFGTFNSWNHNPDEFREVFTATNNEIPVNSIEVTLPRLITGVSRKFQVSSAIEISGHVELQNTFDGKRNTFIKTDLLSIDPIAGLEFGYANTVYLRFGASQFQRITNLAMTRVWRYQPTVGLGFSLKELTIDYALTDVGDTAEGLYSHVFSLKVDFNEK